MQEISTPDAPSPAGHYSQAVVHEGIVYVAGQLPLDPKNAEALPSDPGAQTRRALNNVGVILEAAGSSLSQTLQMTIYVTDIDHLHHGSHGLAPARTSGGTCGQPQARLHT